MSKNNNLSSNLKKLRHEHQLSQTALAEKLHVSRQAVSLWETGKTYPDINTLRMISKLYQIPIDDLLNSCDFLVSTSNTKDNSTENILKTLILITFSTLIPIMGCVYTLAVFINHIKSKQYFFVIYFMCVACFGICLFNSIILFRHFLL